MKSLQVIKNSYNQLILQKRNEVDQIYELLGTVENTNAILDDNNISQYKEYRDVSLKNRLSYYISYLYTKIETLEDEIDELEKEENYIVFKENKYILNPSLPYEKLYSFLERHEEDISFDELKDIFVMVKQIKMRQVVDEAKKEIKPIDITIEEKDNSDEKTEEKILLAEELEESQEIEETEKVSLKNIIIHFAELVANEKGITEQRDAFVEKYYEQIMIANRNCRIFQNTEIYTVLKKNMPIYQTYRANNDLDSLEQWFKHLLPQYREKCSFAFFDNVLESIDNCDNFLMEFQDLTTLTDLDDVDKLFQCFVCISEIEFFDKLQFDFVKLDFDSKIGHAHEVKSRKNLVIYTPESLKSGKTMFDSMLKFVEKVYQNDWDAIVSAFTPNSRGSIRVDSKAIKGFPPSEYLKCATEFEIKGSIDRILGSRDKISANNKKMLMDYFNASEMEIISIHNIFEGPHNGVARGTNQGIGQYGYTPYYHQLNFYRLLGKKDDWEKEEFAYICDVINCCLKITSSIIAAEKDKLLEYSEELSTVLATYSNLKEKGAK